VNRIDSQGLFEADPEPRPRETPGCVTPGGTTGGDSGGGITTCQVEVRGHSKFGAGFHTYTVVTEYVHGHKSKEWLYRAEKGSDGNIDTYGKEVDADTPDIKHPPLGKHSFPVISAGCFFVNLGFKKSTDRIQAMRIEYLLLEQNSNSFTYTILVTEGFTMSMADLDALSGRRVVPGWYHNLFKYQQKSWPF
jgi:hypothetical protein